MRHSKSFNDLNSNALATAAPSQQEEASIADELSKSNHSVRSVLSNISTSIRRTLSTFDTSKQSKSSRNFKSPADAIHTQVSKLSEETLDEQRLLQSLQDAGRNADGVSAVEVWILDRSQGRGAHLTQPPGGFWSSPDFIPDDYEALARISDVKRDDYEYPHPLLVGTGLAGMLWSEKRDSVEDGNRKKINDKRREPHDGPGRKHMARDFTICGSNRSNGMSMHLKSSHSPFHMRSQAGGASFHNSFKSMTNLHANYRPVVNSPVISAKVNQEGLAWRDIHSITVDPYQPTFQRLALLEEAGFTKSAGIRFDMQGVKGIVLFLAGDDVTVARLNVGDNVAYMRAAANLVGAAAALTGHRKALNVRMKQQHIFHQVGSAETKGSSKLYKNVTTWLGKCRGGDLQPPPAMSADEATLTFCGVFVTLVTLHYVSERVEKLTGSGFILGPFGALMTLQYGLTMAPAAQPRNVFSGQIIATVVALLFSSLFDDHMHRHIRIPLTTATVVFIMVSLGITHPPAGATALIVSSGNFGWDHLFFVMLSNAIAIIFSTLINNLSEKRQYPTYFHIGESYISGLMSKFFDRNSKDNFPSPPTKRLVRRKSFSVNDSIRTGEMIRPLNANNNGPKKKQQRESGDIENLGQSSSASLSSEPRNSKIKIRGEEDDDNIGLDLMVNEVSIPFTPYIHHPKKQCDAISSHEQQRSFLPSRQNSMEPQPPEIQEVNIYPNLLAPQTRTSEKGLSPLREENNDFDPISYSGPKPTKAKTSKFPRQLYSNPELSSSMLRLGEKMQLLPPKLSSPSKSFSLFGENEEHGLKRNKNVEELPNPKIGFTYGSMFLVPNSLGQNGTPKIEESNSCDDESSKSSGLEDIF